MDKIQQKMQALIQEFLSLIRKFSALFRELPALIREFKSFARVEGNYVYMCRKVLYYQGFWPATDRANEKVPSRFRYWYPRVVTASDLYMVLIGFPMAAFSAAGQPLLVQLEPVVFIFVSGICISTCVILLYQGDILQETVEAFETMKECATHLPDQLHENQGRRKILCDLTFLISCSVGVFSFFIVPALLPSLISERIFYSGAWYPYDAKTTPYYELTLAWWVWLLLGTALHVCPSTQILVHLQVLAWSHLELLNHNIARLRESALRRTTARIVNDTGESDEEIPFASEDDIIDEMEQSLFCCVRHHQAVYRLVNNLGEAYNLFITQLILSFLITIGLIMYLMQNSDTIGLSFVWLVFVLYLIGTTLLTIFYLADSICEQSALVKESAFACDWIDAPDSFKRSLRIIMSFSNQPLVITAAGEIPLTLVSCLDVCSLTYKYYQFVRGL